MATVDNLGKPPAKRGRPKKCITESKTNAEDVRQTTQQVLFPHKSILVDPGPGCPLTVGSQSPTDLDKESFECQLCPADLPHYQSQEDFQAHFSKLHATNTFSYAGHLVVLCNLPCAPHLPSHYHCPCCGQTIVRFLHMRKHLQRCSLVTHSDQEPSPKRARVQGDDSGQYEATKEKEGSLLQTVNDTVEISGDVHTKMMQLCKVEGSDDQYVLIQHVQSGVPGTEGSSELLGNPGDQVVEVTEILDVLPTSLTPSLAEVKLESVQTVGTTAMIDYNGEELDGTTAHSVNEVLAAVSATETVTSGDQAVTMVTVGNSQMPVISHPSIVRSVAALPSPQCAACCDLVHCPLCPHRLRAAQEHHKVRKHLAAHYSCGVEYQGITSMKCNLPCSSELGTTLGKAHWHCPLCPQKKLHRSRLRDHLKKHVEGKTRSMTDSKTRPMTPPPAPEELLEDGALHDMTVLDMTDLESGQADETQAEASMGDDQERAEPGPSNQALDECLENVQIANQDDSMEKLDEDQVQDPPEMYQEEKGPNEQTIPIDLNHETEFSTEMKSPTTEVPGHDHMESSSDDLVDKDTELNNSKDSDKSSSGVFQVIAGLLSESLVSSLGPLVAPLLSQLSSLTGIILTQNDPSTLSYMMQGAWHQMEKVKVILEHLTEQNVTTEAELHQIVLEICQEKFDMSLPSDNVETAEEHTANIDEINPEDDSNDNLEDNLEDDPDDDQDGDEEDDTNDTVPMIHPEQPCPYCRKIFRYKVSLLTHILMKHDISKPPKYNGELWSVVLRRMSRIHKAQCPGCQKKFKQVINARAHYGTMVCSIKPKPAGTPIPNPDSGLYECSQCDYKARKHQTLMTHVDHKHRPRTIKCNLCEKLFPTERILLKHEQKVHNDHSVCGICGDSVRDSCMEKHQKDHAENRQSSADSIIRCDRCDYRTNKPSLFDRHMKRCKRTEPLECTQCHISFVKENAFHEHMKTIHDVVSATELLKDKINVSKDIGPDQQAPCLVCGKIMLKRNIMAHIRMKHQGIRRYKCPTCSKMFQTKYVLENHKQTHLLPNQRSYTYTCSECNMGFLNKTMYQEHCHLHTNLRPYQCDICQASFRQKAVYSRHRQTHQISKMACPICQRIYKSKYSLQQHIKRHGKSHRLNALMFVCMCGRTFLSQNEMMQHSVQCDRMTAISQPSTAVTEEVDRVDSSELAEDALEIVEEIADGAESLSDLGELQHTIITVQSDLADSTDQQIFIISPPEETTRSDDIAEIRVEQPALDEKVNRVIENDQENNENQIIESELVPEGIQVINTVLSGKSELVTDSSTNGEVKTPDRFLCGYCNTLFDELDSVESHIVATHKDEFPCGTKELQITLQH